MKPALWRRTIVGLIVVAVIALSQIARWAMQSMRWSELV
jgi:hypothetical protein